MLTSLYNVTLLRQKSAFFRLPIEQWSIDKTLALAAVRLAQWAGPVRRHSKLELFLILAIENGYLMLEIH